MSPRPPKRADNRHSYRVHSGERHHITRVDAKDGRRYWLVRLGRKHAGPTWMASKFYDVTYGDEQQALNAAIKWRDKTERYVP